MKWAKKSVNSGWSVEKKKIRNMRKTVLIFITSLLLATGLQGQSRKRGRDATRDPAVNVGIKQVLILLCFIDHFFYRREKNDIQNNYKVGYSELFSAAFQFEETSLSSDRTFLTMFLKEVFQ